MGFIAFIKQQVMLPYPVLERKLIWSQIYRRTKGRRGVLRFVEGLNVKFSHSYPNLLIWHWWKTYDHNNRMFHKDMRVTVMCILEWYFVVIHVDPRLQIVQVRLLQSQSPKSFCTIFALYQGSYIPCNAKLKSQNCSRKTNKAVRIYLRIDFTGKFVDLTKNYYSQKVLNYVYNKRTLKMRVLFTNVKLAASKLADFEIVGLLVFKVIRNKVNSLMYL